MCLYTLNIIYLYVRGVHCSAVSVYIIVIPTALGVSIRVDTVVTNDINIIIIRLQGEGGWVGKCLGKNMLFDFACI